MKKTPETRGSPNQNEERENILRRRAIARELDTAPLVELHHHQPEVRKFVFVPQPDITAYDLAILFSRFKTKLEYSEEDLSEIRAINHGALRHVVEEG